MSVCKPDRPTLFVSIYSHNLFSSGGTVLANLAATALAIFNGTGILKDNLARNSSLRDNESREILETNNVSVSRLPPKKGT